MFTLIDKYCGYQKYNSKKKTGMRGTRTIIPVTWILILTVILNMKIKPHIESFTTT